jgi:hypothetical protein
VARTVRMQATASDIGERHRCDREKGGAGRLVDLPRVEEAVSAGPEETGNRNR